METLNKFIKYYVKFQAVSEKSAKIARGNFLLALYIKFLVWEFSSQKQQIHVFEPPFGGLEVMYVLYLELIEKPMIDFILVTILNFPRWLLQQTEAQRRKPVEVGVFLKAVGHFEAR